MARAHRARAELIRAARPRPLPTVLAIDEAAFKKGQDYNTIVSDLGARYPLETLRGRDGDWRAYVVQADQCVVVMRKDVRVERDSSRLFNSDESEVRAIMRGDFVVPNPSAVVRILGVLA